MELKEYQLDASERLDAWLEELHKQQIEAAKAAELLESNGLSVPDEVSDVPSKTWRALRDLGTLPPSVMARDGHYIQRTTNSGEHLPHVCLKIPTGGGKTLLGAVALERVLAHRDDQTGLVLWIVPSRAIYEQTRSALWDRGHPYRQRLELASGGRVKVMEKNASLSRNDLRSHLCVMLLMLPATNRRKNKEFLLMFQNSGDYPGLFPEDGNALAEGEHALKHPRLERDPSTNLVKQSLHNVFRMARPIVILDEAHKAYGKKKELAEQYAIAISRMDPSIVIELSATPSHEISNILVDVNGTALHDEQMIKLPIEVHTRSDATSWRATLNDARERLDELSEVAGSHEAETGRYIRPIAVVRCENTGKAQRDGVKIHVEDVRDELIGQGVQPEEIKVKSSENDELTGEDLMGHQRRSRVRWILTKDALKEGWDCPFAYVLVLLDRTKAKTAVTQMVGRVLRMPYVEFTDNEALDRCYVYCHDVDVRLSVDFVRAGLENEGMEDLSKWIIRGADGSPTSKEVFVRREQFRGTEIFLPRVLHQGENGEPRELDYSRDILAELDWCKLEVRNPQPMLVPPATGGSATVDLRGDDVEIADLDFEVSDEVDLLYFSKSFAQLIPNPWVCSSIAAKALDHLMTSGGQSARDINVRRSVYAEVWRQDLFSQIDARAYEVFVGKLKSEQISFELKTHECNYELVEEFEEILPDNVNPLGARGSPVQKTLFIPAADLGFNDLERDFAYYLDGRSAIVWWHRVAANQRTGYYVRGWRRNKVFPDFVAMARAELASSGENGTRFVLFETKGKHLKGSDDTQYKQVLFEILQQKLNGHNIGQGVVTIYGQGDLTGFFKMVFEGELQHAFEDTDISST